MAQPGPLDDLDVVYMWVDGVYVKAGLEKEKGGSTGGDSGPERREQGGGERCFPDTGSPQRTGPMCSGT